MPLCAAFALHFPDGPPLAHTGGFGEPTCLECHRGDPLNVPGGELALEGLPEHYLPGRTYDIAVVLRRNGMRVAGFEAAIRFSSGEQAGLLAAGQPAGLRVDRDSTHGVLYAHHTREGTMVAGDSARWLMRWTAPRGREDALVNVTALAGNDDNSNLGDYVHALSAVILR